MGDHFPSVATAAETQRLAQALDALETALDALEPGADSDVVASALADPVRQLDLAAREAVR
jgi:hypothetical protein